MPPQLALALCTAFVIWLLRLERTQAPNVSHIMWLPTLWMLSVSTKPLALWFSYSSGGDEYGSPLDRRFIITMIFAGLFILFRTRFDWAGAIRSQPWLMLLLGYMCVSLLWSDEPYTGFKRLVRQLGAFIMAFVVLSECNPRQAVETILRRTAYILIPFSVLLIKYFPHLGVEFGRWNGARMWVGVSSQKNGLAVVCSVAILFLVWTFVRRWQQERNLLAGGRPAYADLIVLLVALYLLLFPEGKASATSISALGVGVAVLLSLFFRPRLAAPLPKGALVSCVITLIGMGIALPLTGGSFASGFTAALGRDSTLTGRTETWAEIVPLAMSHPILGCGFDSYWTPMTRELHRMSHAHSAYLEMFNELGSLGLLFFTCFAVSFALQSTSSSGFGWKSLCISFLVMALVRGFTESGINSFTSQLGGILVLMSFLLSGQRSCNEWQT